jgi:hypothetical protein
MRAAGPNTYARSAVSSTDAVEGVQGGGVGVGEGVQVVLGGGGLVLQRHFVIKET